MVGTELYCLPVLLALSFAAQSYLMAAVAPGPFGAKRFPVTAALELCGLVANLHCPSFCFRSVLPGSYRFKWRDLAR